MPERIQLRRTKGWRKPEGAVVVSRPSKWGNPFRVYRCDCCGWWDVRDDNGVTYHIDHKVTRAWGRAPLTPQRDQREKRESQAHAVDLFANLFVWDELDTREVRAELAGKDLACWCPLSSPCHVDVLLEIANAPVISKEPQP